MKVLRNVISLALIFCSITSLPVSYGVPENKNGNAHYSGNPKVDSVDGPLTGHLGRAGINHMFNHRYWPNAIVPYTIDGSFSQQQQAMILKAMDTIQLWTCIRFVRYIDEIDYISIKNVPNAGCWSLMGRSGGSQEVLLESPQCFEKIGKVLHVLLTVIGSANEHNRWDRDEYVTVNMTNVIEGHEAEFQKDPKLKTDTFGIPYDYNSVMHFPENAFSRNGEATLITTYTIVQMGQREGMSVRDALSVRKMYDCEISGLDVSTTDLFSKVLPNYGDVPVPLVLSKEELYNIYFRNSKAIIN